MLATGIAFMFEWNPMVHHSDSWNVGSDLWNTLRAAHYVGWGYLGGVYDPANGIITFPGMAALLAPVAMLSGSLHLSESFMPYTLQYPTAALLLVPIELVMVASVVFATDALAERLQLGTRRRAALCVLVAVIAWLTASVWGHPEESLAMTFALYAMIAMLDRKWVRCGWLFSVGIVLQPLVALTLPLFVAATPRGMRIMLAVRSSALSFVLIAVAAAGNAGGTFRALVEQPTPPALNHPTPWVSLAPKITSGGRHLTNYASIVHSHGRISVTHSSAVAQSLVFVAGGPGRMIDVALSVLLGVLVWRRPQSGVRVLWLASCVLASRCFFEPVMTPYYLAPPLFLALVLAARMGGARFWAAAVLSLEVTILAYHHLNPWIWWSAIVLGLAGIVALGNPVDRVPADPLDDGQRSIVPEGPARPGRPAVDDRRSPVATSERDHRAQPMSV